MPVPDMESSRQFRSNFRVTQDNREFAEFRTRLQKPKFQRFYLLTYIMTPSVSGLTIQRKHRSLSISITGDSVHSMSTNV